MFFRKKKPKARTNTNFEKINHSKLLKFFVVFFILYLFVIDIFSGGYKNILALFEQPNPIPKPLKYEMPLNSYHINNFEISCHGNSQDNIKYQTQPIATQPKTKAQAEAQAQASFYQNHNNAPLFSVIDEGGQQWAYGRNYSSKWAIDNGDSNNNGINTNSNLVWGGKISCNAKVYFSIVIKNQSGEILMANDGFISHLPRGQNLSLLEKSMIFLQQNAKIAVIGDMEDITNLLKPVYLRSTYLGQGQSQEQRQERLIIPKDFSPKFKTLVENMKNSYIMLEVFIDAVAYEAPENKIGNAGEAIENNQNL